ncbi:hypothetical protein PHSC3_000504 [Chlamydiales bacterium STE3]|nr:hypothetical protein PHSC3_000504 [Chlamydiales bacterium STE3]
MLNDSFCKTNRNKWTYNSLEKKNLPTKFDRVLYPKKHLFHAWIQHIFRVNKQLTKENFFRAEIFKDVSLAKGFSSSAQNLLCEFCTDKGF